MPIEISRLTREYLFFDLVTPNDLSSSGAEVAFMAEQGDLPDAGDWQEADIVVDASDNQSVRILVGPGHVDSYDLTPPTEESIDYQTWVRISDNPERPVRRPGIVTVL